MVLVDKLWLFSHLCCLAGAAKVECAWLPSCGAVS